MHNPNDKIGIATLGSSILGTEILADDSELSKLFSILFPVMELKLLKSVVEV